MFFPVAELIKIIDFTWNSFYFLETVSELE